jgi:hypothetical protein
MDIELGGAGQATISYTALCTDMESPASPTTTITIVEP